MSAPELPKMSPSDAEYRTVQSWIVAERLNEFGQWYWTDTGGGCGALVLDLPGDQAVMVGPGMFHDWSLSPDECSVVFYAGCEPVEQADPDETLPFCEWLDAVRAGVSRVITAAYIETEVTR